MTAMLDNDTFARDPLAPHSAQFPLGRTNATTGTDLPSEAGIRPWNLRLMEPVQPPKDLPEAGVYDPVRQFSVNADGSPVVAGPPTADSASSLDGDEGPSEDWSYDFAPDSPFPV